MISPLHEVSVFGRRNITAYQELEVRVPPLFGYALICCDALLLTVVFVEVAVVAVPLLFGQAYFLL